MTIVAAPTARFGADALAKSLKISKLKYIGPTTRNLMAEYRKAAASILAWQRGLDGGDSSQVFYASVEVDRQL